MAGWLLQVTAPGGTRQLEGTQMNSNLFRTILSLGAVAMPIIYSIFGCTDIGTDVVCTATLLTPQHTMIISSALVVINVLLKAFQGGPVGAGLVAPLAVISPTGAPGTVTMTQVESGPKK
jgi:hypothetical protein